MSEQSPADSASAAETRDDALAALAGKYLTFLLAGEAYGVNILKVREIIGLQAITRVPDTVAYIKGVINLRGQVIAVIDLRLRFNMPAAEALYAELGQIVAGEADAVALVEALEGIIRDTGLPPSLSLAEVPESDLPMLADDAMLQQRLLVNNPREVSREDALEIYRAAF